MVCSLEYVYLELESECEEAVHCVMYDSSSTVVGASAHAKHSCFQFAVSVLSVSLLIVYVGCTFSSKVFMSHLDNALDIVLKATADVHLNVSGKAH